MEDLIDKLRVIVDLLSTYQTKRDNHDSTPVTMPRNLQHIRMSIEERTVNNDSHLTYTRMTGTALWITKETLTVTDKTLLNATEEIQNIKKSKRKNGTQSGETSV